MRLRPFHSKTLKTQARSLGFVACGVAPAEPVCPEASEAYAVRLKRGFYGEMRYMTQHVEMRTDPQKLVEGVKSIVSVAMPYMPHRQQRGISLYAQGHDYHTLVKDKLRQLMESMHLEGRCFVDTAPVMERYWAWRCGVGTWCRNGLISVPTHGPTVFLGELFLLQEADVYDEPLEPFRLPSTGWENLCPALTEWGLDARRCTSYLTIEHKGQLPQELHLAQTFYGCDKCLRACPEFRLSHAADTPSAFEPSAALLAMTPARWSTLTREEYTALFKGSAVKRAKYEGLQRNIRHWKKNDQ